MPETPEFPIYSGDFTDHFVCCFESDVCMFGKCNKCPKWLEDIKKEIDLGEPTDTVWYQWEKVEQTIKMKNGRRKGKTRRIIKKLKLICKEDTVEESIKSLEDQIPSFLQHVCVKRQQIKLTRTLKVFN